MKLGAVLYVYKGEWGLPSIDFECLRALCVIKFPRCPVKIDTNSNPFNSGAGTLPYLQIGNEKFVGYRSIKELLDKEGYSIDAHLSREEKFLSAAYTILVFNNLHVYFYYYMFGDQTNFEITRSLYAKRTPFPFNFYYPSKYHKDAEKVVDIFGGFEIHDNLEFHETDYIIENAKKCVTLLSKKLGSKNWFFGNNYSEFDAIVYSYLSILNHIQLPKNPLQNHIKECKNLINFINRITKDIFREEGFITKPKGSHDKNETILTSSERQFLATKTRTQILAGIGAFLAMSTYAAWTGLLRLSFDGNYEDDFGYEDETDN